MAVSAIDSRIFRNLFGTQEVREAFSDESYAHHMIATEAALARAQAQEGVIPNDSAESITSALNGAVIDYERLSDETEIVGYPVLPLIQQLIEQTPAEHAKYIHWGATTQDIMDNASMLQMRRGLMLVEGQLNDLRSILMTLSTRYRDTPMAGRTHLQHALPCTFGYKCAVYLSSIVRHLDRLQEIKARCLVVQFGGAAGTLASLGSDDTGTRVRKALARELSLKDPIITWHVARDNVAEILNSLGLIGGTLGKISYDLIVMCSNEVGEVAEPFVPHRGASSTMPQKRNPISSEIMYASAKVLRSNASLGLDAMVVDFERASGPWHLEWIAIPESFVIAVGALHQACFALAGLVVNTETMEKNLASSRGLIVGEAVMMGIAPEVGRQQAHDLVYEACKTAIDQGRSLYDVLVSDKQVVGKVSDEKLKELCDPHRYLGASQVMVDDVVGFCRKRGIHVNGYH
ncbi:Lyase-like protein [Elsinoe fawcettii]|nr:Lyase-like protein [Elsinoe fawcettii]